MSDNPNNLTFVSEPKEVDMAEEWFAIASPQHFWMRRRWHVLSKLLKTADINSLKTIGDIGCGIGTQTSILEERYQTQTHGFDLNGTALARAAIKYPDCQFFCMDILASATEFHNKYDALFILDVIEHVERPVAFLRSCSTMLSNQGIAIINVPALPFLFSAYDTVVGHHRRYHSKALVETVELAGLKPLVVSYWGLPYLPLLLLRKIMCSKPSERTVKRGFSSKGRMVNQLLGLWGKFEFIPNHFLGTSLSIVARKQ